jgi:O-antigen ligase
LRADSVDPVESADAWPRTRRPLPWLLAAFLAAIFLLPIKAIHLKIQMPVSSDFDRFLVALIVVAWVVCGLVNRGATVVRRRPRGWAAGMAAFVLVAVASIALNVDRITNLGEWEVVQKRVALLIALVAVFVIVTLTLRVAELRPFAVLIAVLATITALGTIYEKKSGHNLFYDTAAIVLSPAAGVDPAPTEVDPEISQGRPLIVGPTRHPLSVTSILGMALPFAVVLAAVAPDLRRRLLWALAAAIIVAGALITQRKSGVVIPAFALLAMFVLQPRLLLRLAPYGLAGLVLAVAAAPGAFSSFQELGRADSQASVEGRTADYPAIVPDLLTNPLLGRGYGTLDATRVDTDRIFDNEYLGQALQVGGLGLIAFLALILAPLFVVRSALRSDSPLRGPPALAAAASCLAFGVASALYDILSFPQAPYLFLFTAAICTCAASEEVPAAEPARPLRGVRPEPVRV